MVATHGPLRVPPPHELVGFFEVSPCEEKPEDGVWCYEVEVSKGWILVFCFNVVERWLKTQMVIGGQVVEEVVQEGATHLWVEDRPRGEVLVGECELGQGRTRLEIAVRPEVSLSWRTLVTSH